MKVYPTAASHRLAKHVGPGGNVTLPAPKIKSKLPPMEVSRGSKPCELRGAGVTHERYAGPSALKVEVLRHTNVNRKWIGKRTGSVQPIVTERREAERELAFRNATKWGVK